jgi:hypothetical protein
MTEAFHGAQGSGSPLFMVMHDPVLHEFISSLEETRRRKEEDPSTHVRIELSRDVITHVRESFKKQIIKGEFRLHLLAHLLATQFFRENFELHSNAIGILPGGERRPFLIRERISPEMLFTQTDLELGKQMVGNFQYRTEHGWSALELSANYVEYLPVSGAQSLVNRLTSRVKAEEEIWNKVTDELFSLDLLVERDKHLQRYSKYIKDVFGIKIVCESDAACWNVHEQLLRLKTEECDFSMAHGASGGDVADEKAPSGQFLLDVVETKDYLTCEPSRLKKTGWKAIKSVVRWGPELFEIQIQPLGNYYLEVDHMSGPSHQSFKLTRESLRDEIAHRVPLYGFYRELLKMLFLSEAKSFEYKDASVVIA